MSYARVIVAGQWHYHDDVVAVRAESRGHLGEFGDYLVLDLASHPHRVFYWRSVVGGNVSVLLAATVEDYIALLQEEDAARRLHKEDAC